MRLTNININNLKERKTRISKTKSLATIGTILVLSLTGCSKAIENAEQLSPEDYKKELSTSEEVSYRYANICDEDLINLNTNVKDIAFDYCNYIEDIDIITEKCPNLENLTLDCCPAVSDLSFIYQLEDLEYVFIRESAYVTEELVNYLDNNNIRHNITPEMIDISKEVDDIIKKIIRPNMTDQEKIQTITSYVIKNYSYDENLQAESNEFPLTTMLKEKKGVCRSFSYLTNILLQKSGIKSYIVESDNHAWNIVNIDNKYYYIDTTNINVLPLVSNYLLENLNTGLAYMTSPSNHLLSATSSYDSDQVIIPEKLVEDIKETEDEKSLYEKYGRSNPARMIEFLSIASIPAFIIKKVSTKTMLLKK